MNQSQGLRQNSFRQNSQIQPQPYQMQPAIQLQMPQLIYQHSGSKQYEERADEIEEVKEELKKGRPIVIEILVIILTAIFELIYIIGYVFFSIAQIFIYFYLLVKGQSDILSDLLDPILTAFFSSVKCYIIYQFIMEYHTDSIDKQWLMNAFYLLLTQVLVLSYIKWVKYADQPLTTLFSYKNFLNKSNISNSFIQFQPQDSNHVFDINNNSLYWKEEYKRIIEVYEVDLNCQKFNTFFSMDDNPTTYDWRGYSHFIDMNSQLQPIKIQFLALLCVSFLKIGFTLLYIFNKEQQFGSKEIINIVVLTFFYLNFSYSLNRVLSNYDLRRKRQILKNLNGMIQISGDIINYFEKLDVTSAISIETWDNSRRCVYDFFRSEQIKLEACYICLFFYYLFAALACASFYGDFYIFFSKDSIHLRPLMVISYSMDFIFFSIILFVRIYSGQAYNNTFEKSEHRIDGLIGIIQDLSQMYDYYFGKKFITADSLANLIIQQDIFWKQVYIKKNTLDKSEAPKAEPDKKDEEEEEEDRDEGDDKKVDTELVAPEEIATIYDILVAKLKYTSRFFIQKKKEFLGSRYHTETEKLLQQKIMQNMLQSYSRIRSQITADEKAQSYKFLNYFHLRFEETFIAITVALGTVLPSILTKFIDIFY